MNLCANHRIFLWNLIPVSEGFQADVCAKQFKELAPLARKCHTKVRVQSKTGLPFFLHRHRKRKVFALGLLFCGFFIFFLSTFIWKIQIDGNLSLSRQTILGYLQESGISYGEPKGAIDCKALAADLRSRFSQLTWVSVRLQGTGLFIRVQENTDAVEEILPAYEDSDLVAEADGQIVKMITRTGEPLVKAGDEVKKGDLLVQGRLAVTNDAQEVVGYQYCASDADIYLKRQIPYRDDFSRIYPVSEYTGRRRYGGYLRIMGHTFGLDGGCKKFKQADFISEEKQLRLFSDFYLPVYGNIICAREYRTVLKTYTEKEAKALAEERLQKFLSEKEQKGVQIFEKNVRIDISATSCRMTGTITVIEKTGRRVRTDKTENLQEDVLLE